MKIERFIFSPFQENTYVVWDEDTKETIIIDPGCLDNNEEVTLKSFIIKNNLNVKYLLNTHGHLDHIFGNAFVKETFNPIHYVPKKDMPLFERAKEQAEHFGLSMKPSPKPDEFFDESIPLFIGKKEIQFLFTPGHSPGEFCFLFPSENICFSGDVLFRESIGRTDLWGGDLEVLKNSINTKLFILPNNTVIYPGHGEKSTIEHEKKNNPFLY